jgi:hypothetical protein
MNVHIAGEYLLPFKPRSRGIVLDSLRPEGCPVHGSVRGFFSPDELVPFYRTCAARAGH